MCGWFRTPGLARRENGRSLALPRSVTCSCASKRPARRESKGASTIWAGISAMGGSVHARADEVMMRRGCRRRGGVRADQPACRPPTSPPSRRSKETLHDQQAVDLRVVAVLADQDHAALQRARRGPHVVCWNLGQSFSRSPPRIEPGARPSPRDSCRSEPPCGRGPRRPVGCRCAPGHHPQLQVSRAMYSGTRFAWRGR